jgi:hypothetical protein
MDSERFTSDSRLMPSGVNSKAQAKMTTGIKPTARNRNMNLGAQPGNSNTGVNTSTICMSSQEATP